MLVLYGAGLARLLAMVREATHERHNDTWAKDPLLAALLELHGLDGEELPEGPDANELRRIGERLDGQLEEMSVSPLTGEQVRALAEDLLGVVVGLHGEGLARAIDASSGIADLPARLTADDLVASLLVTHDLHPLDAEARVGVALDRVRADLAAEPVTIELTGMRDGVAHVRVAGDQQRHAWNAGLAVERELERLAPDLLGIEVEGGEEPLAPSSVMIPIDQVTIRRNGSKSKRPTGKIRWLRVPGDGSLAPGEIRALGTGDEQAIACRVGTTHYAFRDRCPSCSGSLAQAGVEREVGAGGVLVCARCRTHYRLDGRGRSVQQPELGLETLPVVVRDGVVEVAVPEGAR